jgi:hypothetical protein
MRAASRTSAAASRNEMRRDGMDSSPEREREGAQKVVNG